METALTTGDEGADFEGRDWPRRLEIAPGVLFCRERVPEGWTPLSELPLIVLFGPTGVGKSTALQSVREAGLTWQELPDRRTLTSELVVAPQLGGEGESLPRLRRYQFVRSFRERYPGGMVELLSRMAVDRRTVFAQPVFDGLRGVAEASAAVRSLPRARFLVLHCPDAVRLRRLLERRDPHDRAVGPSADADPASSLAEMVPESLAGVLTAEEQTRLMELVRSGETSEREMRTKLRILAEERLTHDPDGTRDLLRTQCADRTLVIDSSRLGRKQVGRRIVQWLGEEVA